jgi:hypothetical protein
LQEWVQRAGGYSNIDWDAWNQAVAEKGPESHTEIDNRFLHGALGDIVHPRELLALDGIECATQGEMGRLAASPILASPLGERQFHAKRAVPAARAK